MRLILLIFCAVVLFGLVHKVESLRSGRIAKLEARVDSLQRVADSLETVVNRKSIWMSRAILSETKKPSEFDEIGTVILNRSRKSGKSVREVVLEPFQFSAFNSTSRFHRMTAENTPFPDLWAAADSVSRRLMALSVSERPLGPDVTHFYSPRSMNGPAPKWAAHMREVPSSVSTHRFRYYAN